MPRVIQISPSILSADFLNLERDISLIASSEPKPEWLHLDVMDGHFVPNLTIGPAFVKALKKKTDIPLDVHLMVDNPSLQVDWYLDAGADCVTIHIESPAAQFACALEAMVDENDVREKASSYAVTSLGLARLAEFRSILYRIHLAGAKAGVALNPDTPALAIKSLIGYFDIALIMSVHPGFGGQSLIPSCLRKIRRLAQLRKIACEEQGFARANFLIEVDGGINVETARLAVLAGADILVAGNAIFNADDPLEALAQIRRAADSCFADSSADSSDDSSADGLSDGPADSSADSPSSDGSADSSADSPSDDSVAQTNDESDSSAD